MDRPWSPEPDQISARLNVQITTTTYLRLVRIGCLPREKNNLELIDIKKKGYILINGGDKQWIYSHLFKSLSKIFLPEL